MRTRVFLLIFAYALGVANCDRSVVIVGAGASGIAAATKLIRNGIKNVTILEAEGRIGGRIDSVKVEQSFVDLGAEWCLGDKDNIVYEMMKDDNVLKRMNLLDSMKLYYSSGEEIDPDLSSKLVSIMGKIWKNDEEAPESLSLGDYYMEQFNKSILELNPSKDKLRFIHDFINFFEHFVAGGEFSWHEASTKNNMKMRGGGTLFNFNGQGYKTVLDKMMKDVEISDKILLGKEVVRITWNHNHLNPDGVSLLCADGSTYDADHVIFTPSVGVLRERRYTLFRPLLPRDKQAIIRHLGMGALVKVMLQFPESWWPKANFSGFNLVWNRDDRRTMNQIYPAGKTKTGRSWLLDAVGFFPIEGVPNVLSVWFSGHTVPEIEKLDEKSLLDGIMFILDMFLGRQHQISQATLIKRSEWSTNHHFVGTASYQTMLSRQDGKNPNLELGKPLKNDRNKLTLLFAGEATHPDYYASVHGAIESGHREANRILSIKHA